MKGDFSRISFDPGKHFSRVLLQQGRVTLDADPNEQSAILLHYLRALARDLIGPCGGPADNLGFGLSVATEPSGSLQIGAGHYYVDGILCESDGGDFASQANYPFVRDGSAGQGDDALLLAQLKNPDAADRFWIYLDVWERHISWIEDDSIRDVALNGVDTCTRAQVVWQVKALAQDAVIKALEAKIAGIDAKLKTAQPPLDDGELATLKALRMKLATDLQQFSASDSEPREYCNVPLDVLDPLGNARMAARLDPGQQIPDPCVIAPDARYRGAENQLYRVEIHRGGTAGTATFKWSRDNGSVAAAWLGTSGNDLLVSHARGFEVGDWVELSDETGDLLGQPGVLVRLVGVGPGKLSIHAGAGAATPPDVTKLQRPKVRRWNQVENDDIDLVDGAIPITEQDGADWVTLEDGIQIRFDDGGEYRCGDYWLIPARVATGTIDWPADGDVAPWQPPLGIEHHYAPLGLLSWSDSTDKAGAFSVTSCQCQLRPINSCAARHDVLGGKTQPAPPLVAPAPAPAPVRAAVTKVAGKQAAKVVKPALKRKAASKSKPK